MTLITMQSKKYWLWMQSMFSLVRGFRWVFGCISIEESIEQKVSLPIAMTYKQAKHYIELHKHKWLPSHNVPFVNEKLLLWDMKQNRITHTTLYFILQHKVCKLKQHLSKDKKLLQCLYIDVSYFINSCLLRHASKQLNVYVLQLKEKVAMIAIEAKRLVWFEMNRLKSPSNWLEASIKHIRSRSNQDIATIYSVAPLLHVLEKNLPNNNVTIFPKKMARKWQSIGMHI